VLTLLVMYVGSGLLLVGLSIPLILGKIKTNGFYGFRVKSTMENPALWYAVNTYAGWRLLATGLVTVVSAIGLYFVQGLSLDTYALACLGVFAVVFLGSLIQSILYLRKINKSGWLNAR
jgi:hypothetical protein